MAEIAGPQPRGPEHERLTAFVGRWHAKGIAYGSVNAWAQTPPSGLPWVSGELVEWHPGGFFIVRDEDATAGPISLITHTIMGWDAEAGCYVAHAIASQGAYRRYAVRNDGRLWTFAAEDERGTVEFSADGARQAVLWEWRPAGRWLPFCERTAVKVDQAAETLSNRPA